MICYDVCTSSYICILSTNVLSQSISALCLGRVCMFCTGFLISDVASSIVVRTPPFVTGDK